MNGGVVRGEYGRGGCLSMTLGQFCICAAVHKVTFE